MINFFREWFKQKKARRENALNPEKKIVVYDDGDVVSVTEPAMPDQSISWDSLSEVQVHTNNTGPWGMNVWFVLLSSDTECRFPLGATGYEQVVERLEQLPGFKLDGMNSTSNAIFKCWERDKQF